MFPLRLSCEATKKKIRVCTVGRADRFILDTGGPRAGALPRGRALTHALLLWICHVRPTFSQPSCFMMRAQNRSWRLSSATDLSSTQSRL